MIRLRIGESAPQRWMQKQGDELTQPRFGFHRREGAWVLFLRLYVAKDRKEPRLPDGLAVHTHTGEIRCYVEASEGTSWRSSAEGVWYRTRQN